MAFTRTAGPLTLEQVRERAPSAFAMEADASRSARYTYIPTLDILRGMEEAGFLPFQASQSRTKDLTRKEHTKHMIRFRHMDAGALQVQDVFPEVVLVNSHDGSSAYNLMAGIFRLVCSNGMIVADSMLASVHVRHQGDVVKNVIDASYEIIEQTPRTLDTIKEWQGLQLTAGEKQAFADSAHILRFADSEGHSTSLITPDQLLTPRRYDDKGDDLWSVFNRVQENTIKGGLTAVKRDENGRRVRRVRTRHIKGIDQDVKLNKALWQLSERMAALKAA